MPCRRAQGRLASPSCDRRVQDGLITCPVLRSRRVLEANSRPCSGAMAPHRPPAHGVGGLQARPRLPPGAQVVWASRRQCVSCQPAGRACSIAECPCALLCVPECQAVPGTAWANRAKQCSMHSCSGPSSVLQPVRHSESPLGVWQPGAHFTPLSSGTASRTLQSVSGSERQ